MLTLASIGVTLLSIGFVLVCLIMMLVILVQKPRGGGLSGAFGGGGGSAQAAFGARTGDVLTWFTVGCFVAFLLLAMGLTWAIVPTGVGEADAAANVFEEAAEQATMPLPVDETGGDAEVGGDGIVPGVGAETGHEQPAAEQNIPADETE